MKAPLFLSTLFLIPFWLQAQPQTRVTIRSATVFLNGAELVSQARVNLPKGESDVVFTNIAGNINEQSLTLGAENGVVVQSATFQNNFLGDSSLTPRARMLRDSIQLLHSLAEELNDQKLVLEEQLAILKENRKVSGAQTGLSVLELQKLLELVNARMSNWLTASRAIQFRITKNEERITLLSLQLDEEQKKNYQPGGQLLVRFYAPEAAHADIHLSYVVPNAGWRPAYDLRVEGVGEPVKLFYKAQVFQNSGVAWKDIRLSLSTGNPNEGAEAPVLNPWNLSFYQPAPVYGYNGSGSILSKPPAASYNLQNSERSAMALKAPEDLASDQPTTLNNYTLVDNSGINTSFDIELAYSIPSDGQQHHVAIKTYELPATYRHFSVPKLDRDVFLQAQITKWEDLNLLPAPTSVFFEGSYVGQGFIDMRNVRDTLNLSLGRDKKIIVRRERIKDFHSVKTIGSNERQSFAYTISVRNTRKELVHLVVIDQLPISNDKDLLVEDSEAAGAELEAATGAARWTLDIKPSELRLLKLSYSLKYPKGRLIGNLN